MSSNTIFSIYHTLKADYRNSQKRIFDAEHYFFRWYRPVSFLPTAVLISRGVSANAVTFVGAGVLLVAFFVLSAGYLIQGALLYLLAYILDFVDGNIARHYGHPTFFGKMIDGLVDSMTFVLFIALAFGNVKSGNPVFGASAEVFLGLTTGFGFLFRAYFYIRVAFVLSQASSHLIAEADSPQGGTNMPASSSKPRMLLVGKKIYFGLISGMPVFLVAAALCNAVSLYLIVYFAVFVFATLLEVAYGLVRVRRKDRR